MDDFEKTIFVTILGVILAPYLLISVWEIVNMKPDKPRYVPPLFKEQANG